VVSHGRGRRDLRVPNPPVESDFWAGMDVTALADKQTAITAHLAALKDDLSFSISLTAEDRQALPKMGDKTRAFVEKAPDVTTRHPEIFSGRFNAEGFRHDVELARVFTPILHEVRELYAKLDDTVFTASSEAFSAALLVYQCQDE
jgi:hypothetical protein